MGCGKTKVSANPFDILRNERIRCCQFLDKISLRDDIPLLQIVREARKTERNIDKIQNHGEEEVALTFPHTSEGQRSYPHADCPFHGSFAQGTT